MIELLVAVALACSSPWFVSTVVEGHGNGKEVIAKTGSMLPNIPIDSKLLVDESFYLRRRPRRFDIVLVRRTFRNPGDSAPTYNSIVSRVVGLPGEAISIRRGNLYINGRRIKEPFPIKPCPSKVDDTFPCSEMSPVRIPAGQYFLLADNRAESEDSRLWLPKTVSRNDLLGKVVRIILPTSDANVRRIRPGSNSSARRLAEINLADIGAIGPKGRVQDTEYKQLPVVERLIAHGKESVPYLISKLDDETKIGGHVVDYWYDVRVGDVALIILTDFFTDSTWQKTTISGVGWDKFLERGDDTNLTGEQLLRNYISKYGRTKIKERWQQIWQEYRNEIQWDEKERCFKVTKAIIEQASIISADANVDAYGITRSLVNKLPSVPRILGSA